MTAPAQDPPKDDQNDQQQGSPPPAQSPPEQQDTGTTDTSDDGGESGESGDLSIEDQLDAERKKNIQLRRQLTKTESEKKKADAAQDAVKERDQYKEENDKLKGLLNGKYLVWCIATDKKHSWQDPADVVKFIERDEINIDVESGTVDGLDMALKRIAKDKPYLLVPEQDDNQQRPPSGTHPQGGRQLSVADETKRLGAKYKIPGFGTQAQKFM